jgi:DNA-binding MarR family transcriptional regulator
MEPSIAAARSGRAAAAAAGPASYSLAGAAFALRSDLQARVGRLGLHLGQELILVDLHRNPGSTQAELVARMGIEQPTIAKATARMERAGFLERAGDVGDRRVVRLRLSERGEEAVESVVAAWSEVERRATSGLTDAEVRELIRLLDRVRDNLA